MLGARLPKSRLPKAKVGGTSVHHVTDDGTTDEPDGVVDGDDPWYWFCYDDGWRIVATFRAADDDPKEVFAHHNAGAGRPE